MEIAETNYSEEFKHFLEKMEEEIGQKIKASYYLGVNHGIEMGISFMEDIEIKSN